MTPPPQCEGERHGQLNLLESAGLLAPACDQATADLARWALLSTLQHRERIKQCKEIRDLDDDLGNGDGEDIGSIRAAANNPGALQQDIARTAGFTTVPSDPMQYATLPDGRHIFNGHSVVDWYTGEVVSTVDGTSMTRLSRTTFPLPAGSAAGAGAGCTPDELGWAGGNVCDCSETRSSTGDVPAIYRQQEMYDITAVGTGPPVIFKW